MGRKKQKGNTRIIFSRTGLFILLILLQVATAIVTTEDSAGIYRIYPWDADSIGRFGFDIHCNSEGNPAFKMTWMLCIMAFPVVGTIFYIYVKMQVGTRWMGERLADLRLETEKYMVQDMEVVKDMKASKSANANLAYYLSNLLGFPVYRNTEVTYFPLGEDKFEALIPELEKAEKFIFMEYFIVEKGYMWKKILDVLAEKAALGVEVRFMYDGMCSISMLPYDYPEQLQKYGIKCKMVSPVRPFLSTVQNNRDHRKICVIDGKVGITGGVNIGDEYINRKERFGHWKDTAWIILKGDAVQSLTMIFRRCGT